MRLFVALQIPEQVRDNIAAVRQRFTSSESQMKWVSPEKFHVTLKFIGEVAQQKVEEISKALREVRTPGRVEVVCRELGWYWNAKGFGLLLATIDPSDSLTILANKIGRQLEPLGIAPDTHDYRPHLTLARCKALEHRWRSAIPKDIVSVANEYKEHLFGSVSAQTFDRIDSKLDPDGSKYTTINTFRFAATAAA
jgi:RNA 2',3'-cyclic 3'-phosphodiesterase